MRLETVNLAADCQFFVSTATVCRIKITPDVRSMSGFRAVTPGFGRQKQALAAAGPAWGSVGHPKPGFGVDSDGNRANRLRCISEHLLADETNSVTNNTYYWVVPHENFSMKLTRIAGSAPWASGLASFFLLALLAGSVMYWAMVLGAPATSIAPAGSLVSRNAGLDTGLAASLFGRADGAPRTASAPLPRNIRIVGIAASSDRSAAIIAVDGQPAGAFGVGQQIDDSLKVVSVSATEVVFDHRGEQIRVPAPASADLSALNANRDEQTASAQAQPRQADNNRLSPPVPAVATARPPLPPRQLPPAGAAAAGVIGSNPGNAAGPAPDRRRQQIGATPSLAANSQNSGAGAPGSGPPPSPGQSPRRLRQTQTALGQAFQGIGRNNGPVVQQ